MKKDEVPQQAAKAFMGHSKALYAIGESGRYEIVPSKGWEAEEIVLDQAIAVFDEAAAASWKRAKAGESSSLEYYMFKCRMDLLLLAQSSGFFKWQVKRHLRPEIFKKLPPKTLARYAAALGQSAETLQTLPEQP